MTTITLPRVDIPLTLGGDRLTRDWYRWMHDITQRVGGPLGAGTDDLSASAFEDAGIEETKSLLFAQAGDYGQVPPVVLEMASELQRMSVEIEELRGMVAEMQKALEGAQQGVTA